MKMQFREYNFNEVIIFVAATFHNGIIDLHQILMTKGINNDLPMTRWY